MDRATDKYVFGPFVLGVDTQSLTCNSEPVQILPKCLGMLVLFVRNANRIVTKEEILAHLWPGEAVDESHVSQCVYRLRHALAQWSPEKYISTVPKRGYRFSVPIALVAAYERPARTEIDAETYRIYQQGRFLCEQRTERGLREGLLRFEAALARTPNFALAHLGIAETCCNLAKRQHVKSHIAFPRASAAALRALELDPDLGEANAVMGDIFLFYSYNFALAEEFYRSALARNPGYFSARYGLVWMLTLICHRFDEALSQITYALENDPASEHWHTMFGIYLYARGQYLEARDYFSAILQENPSGDIAQLYNALSALHCGQTGLAIDLLSEMSKANDRPYCAGYLGYAYAATGDERSALRILKRLNQLMATKEQGGAYYRAVIYAGLKQTNRALENLEDAIRTREPAAIHVITDPCFRLLSEHPRFKSILAQMGDSTN